MRKKLVKVLSTLVMSAAIVCSGIIPSAVTGGADAVKAESKTVYASDVDADYAQTNGCGVLNGVLSNIKHGEKARFNKVKIGASGEKLHSITFNYAKPSTDTVTVQINLDSEDGIILGSWQLNEKTDSVTDFTTQKFTTFNKNDINGTHDLYLKFSCTNTIDGDIVQLKSFTITSGDGENEAEHEAINNAHWEDQYMNKSNKKKPHYYPNIYLRTSYVVFSDENDAYNDKVIFGDPYAIKNYKSPVRTVSGISYNYNTNTLTLTNCNYPDNFIQCRNMGSTFKIKLVGKNTLRALAVSGANWPTPLHLTGSGSIVLNPNKAYHLGPGFNQSVLYLDGWHKEKFIIDKKTKVTAYGYGKTSPVILSYGEGRPALKKAVKITLGKNKKLNGKFVNGSKDRIKNEYKFNKKKFVKK
ncbi:carbohydrate-binding protein [Butyrivibrio sp. VCD2006]|uniref:carbohydrate-binding protein n=1 Tax=Butyrivibrio sp. VCD2006 TaxID=1280664 RepID=UPI000478D4FF|nr:carbohydrate-binding protein [Butyrivibrio sp. VCD2006]